MKLVFAGGGTMGHVSPSLAIAKEHLRHTKKGSCIFFGREGGKENDAVTKEGYTLYTLAVTGFVGKNPMQILGSFRSMSVALKVAYKILEEEKPDCVIGTGGYVSYPVLSAATRLGIPTVIHESNATPGVATKLLSKSVDLILLGMKDSEGNFKKSKKAVYVGTPVDRAFYTTSRERARERLGVGNRRLILSFGGSLGAEAINRFAIKAAGSMKGSDTLWIHASGRRYYESMKAECEKNPVLRLLPYIDDMPTYLTAADLAVCRAGASTIAELQATGTSSILIPSPNVAGNHQLCNADRMQESGQALILSEEKLGTPEAIEMLTDYLYRIPKHPKKPNAQKLAQARALEEIYALIRQKKEIIS